VSLDTLAAVEAFQAGRAQRTAMACHRRLHEKPLMICAFQLGGEPFSVNTIAWGTKPARMRMAVIGDARNRDLLFDGLLPFCRDFNAFFEAPFAHAYTVTGRGGRERTVVDDAPQIVVPNAETGRLLGRLGRRMRFLDLGAQPVDPALVTCGSHLAFLGEQLPVAGQNLVIDLVSLLQEHWAFALNSVERANLAALDAFIDPPAGLHGHEAAAREELDPIGPRPDADQDGRAEQIITVFNARRARSTDPAVVKPLLAPVKRHYEPLLRRTWAMAWRRLDGERALPTARFVSDREAGDRDAYAFHMDGVGRGIRRRARRTIAQAIERVRDLESRQSAYLAQVALDDPLKMVDVLARGEAIIGRVSSEDPHHQVQGPKNMVCRPLVDVDLDGECPLEPGDQVVWDQAPGGTWTIEDITPLQRGGERARLRLENPNSPRPAVGDLSCFAALSPSRHYSRPPSRTVPWTHQAPVARPRPGSIEDDTTMEQAA
jgi:hypothetical protein